MCGGTLIVPHVVPVHSAVGSSACLATSVCNALRDHPAFVAVTEQMFLEAVAVIASAT
jgi:hypothetical protein